MASSGIPTPFHHLPLSTPQSPALNPQQRAEAKRSTSDSRLNLARPNITISGTSTPTRAMPMSPMSGVLSNVTSNTQIPGPDGILSREAVYAEAFNAATRALPQDAKPQCGKDKFKAKLRRALLRRFILRMLIGKGPADFVYPWLHPKAGGFSTM